MIRGLINQVMLKVKPLLKKTLTIKHMMNPLKSHFIP